MASKPRPPLQPVDLKAEVAIAHRIGIRKWLLNKLVVAFEEARKGKLKTSDENSFELHWIENLIELRNSIIERRYKPGSSVAFVVFDPMVREIFAAPFRDRVDHHFLYMMQAGWWDRRFISNSFSCRVGKGTLKAIQCAKGHMLKVTKNCTEEAVAFKGDIKGYFMSLPRVELYKRIKWGLDLQFAEVKDDPMGHQIYDICRYMWEKVLFDDPVAKSWRRGDKKNWNPRVLPTSKSLYHQPPGYGIVIGNLTSQLVSNIYMDLLDRFIFHTLGYKYYARYVDDFYIMVPKKDWPQLRKDIPRIEAFLADEMQLTLHKRKRSVQSVYKGMNFVGARVYPHCIYPSNRIQSHFPKALEALLYEDGALDPVISYAGIMQHFDSYKYIKKLMDKYEM